MNRADPSRSVRAATAYRSSRLRDVLAELALFAAAGILLALLGPYETYRLPVAVRLAYWLACMIGGGGIGIATDRMLAARVSDANRRLLLAALVMTLPVTLLVFAIGRAFGLQQTDPAGLLDLVWQVAVISLAVMAVRAVIRRPPRVELRTTTLIQPPLPDAELAFRGRLSASRRAARLIAVEADDHYLNVHTDRGTELLTMRFVEALAELAGAHGLQVHRSWWVAGDAIETVRWRRGGGTAQLVGGRSAPISRTFAPALRAAGWK